MHVGPVYNLNFGPSPIAQDTKPSEESVIEIPPKEKFKPLRNSKRLVGHEDINLVSKLIGANWKKIGKDLELDRGKLEQFKADTKTMSDAVLRMLFKWFQWRDEEATVGKLTKVLFKHKE